MAWNEPGNKDPWGRNKNNSNLDGVFKDFKKTFDDLLGSSGSATPPSPKKKRRFSCSYNICCLLPIWHIHRK